MLKLSVVCTTLIASIFSGSATAIGGGYDPEDEPRAWADRPGVSAEYGGAQEAIAMLRRAVAAVKADEAGAIAKFNHNEQLFRDRDLFIFCFNGQDGRYTAHEAFVAWDARKFRDAKGKAVGAEMYTKAQEGRITDVTYTSPVAGSTELATKKAYVTRIGDQVCGVSAYQFNRGGSPTK
jgi:hypothetical protein